jgi:4-hydroxybenzoate polyprenyltransferase/phosphoserine phosphatase
MLLDADAERFSAAESEPPLFVDLDGTLIRTDLLWECLANVLRRDLPGAAQGVAALRNGRAAMKRALAEAAEIDVARLPYRTDLLEWLRFEAARGRRVYLATASDVSLARAVARHLSLFDDVIASDGVHNRKAFAKLEAIRELAKGGPFDYVGNGRDDLPLFKAARQAIVAGAEPALLRHAQRIGNVQRVFADQQTLAVWFRAVRPHQWLKNLLVFVPLLTSFGLLNPSGELRAALCFIAFSLVASAGYLLNDVLDAQIDRRHPRKSHRPVAAGQIGIAAAFCVAFVLVLLSGGLGWWIGPRIVQWLFIYLLLTLAYSLWVKRLAIFDVGTLAALYTTRVIVGGVAVQAPVSFWLLAFSSFLFFSLAALKRCGELVSWRDRGESTSEGRAYSVSDLSVLMPLGLATSISAVLVFALYVQSPDVQARYGSPDWLWLTLSAMLLWLSRLWLITHRGEMDDDPLVFAARDPVSLLLLAAMMIGFAAAALLG